jgi:hypothetical protein
MQIDESDEQKKNARSLIDESCEPDSNVTVEREWHMEKQCPPSFSTEEGMQIDESDVQHMNAASPIEQSPEPDSKITFEIFLRA